MNPIDYHFCPRQSLLHSFIALLLVSLLLHGCGFRSASPPSTEHYIPSEKQIDETPIPQAYSRGPAHTLYEDAQKSMSEGLFDKAVLILERAIRIEPGNPYYWYTMGKVKYRQGALPQAIQFCLKSKSLASGSLQLVRINDTLIQKAQQELRN